MVGDVKKEKYDAEDKVSDADYDDDGKLIKDEESADHPRGPTEGEPDRFKGTNDNVPTDDESSGSFSSSVNGTSLSNAKQKA